MLERVLTAAARTPSGGNLQPWNTYVLTGASLDEVKNRTAQRLAAGDPGDEREFEMYPRTLKSPYCERQLAAREQRFAALGIPPEDRRARWQSVTENWNCFGAPAALFFYIDRDMGAAQWADLGMYLQTIMLLLRTEGLHSCPQMAWSVYRLYCRRDCLAAPRSRSILWPVDWVRGPQHESRAHQSCATYRDGHVPRLRADER